MMTPGDFASLQEGREGLSTEDYIAWKLPYVPAEIVFRSKAYSERMLIERTGRRKIQTTTPSR